MSIKDLVTKNRSYRRFYQNVEISRDTLKELVDLARLSSSAGNLQPLKYFLSSDPATNSKIFPHLAWAGAITNWGGPVEGERPAAYIVILGDTRVVRNFGVDPGIAAQSILLGATEKGLGGCMIASIKKPELKSDLGIHDQYEILLVIAIGKPKEKVVLEVYVPPANIKYWRDSDQVHHVPKRKLEDIII